MLDRVMTTSLEDVVETDEVGLDVGIRIGDGISYTCLGCQIHHHVEIVDLSAILPFTK